MATKVAGRGGHRWRKVRERVKRSQRVCWICGNEVDLDLDYPDPMSFSVDHVVPLAHGGKGDDYANCRASHLACNQSRGARGGNAELRTSEDW